MSDEMNYVRKTEAELEQLAWDVVGGKVWGTWNIPPGEDPILSFMLLAFMTKEHIDRMKKLEITHLYEYMSEAGERSINGMPTFFSARFLDKHDAEVLHRCCEELNKLKSDRLKAVQ